MAKVLFVIAPIKFRDEELFQPKEVLEEAGHSCTIASTRTEECTGMLGATVTPDLNVSDVSVDEYDAVVMVGGVGVYELVDNEDVLRIFRDAKEEDMLIGAICAGPLVLASAGILKGVTATLYPTPESVEKFKSLGANYVKEDVVIDGNIITACGPQVAREFGEKLRDLL